MTSKLLSGIKVLDLTTYVAGPYCTKLLADYGAEVIKVENPRMGDPTRYMGPYPNDQPHAEKSGLFLYLNTNKKSITLNLNDDLALDILKKLAAKVDILVESFRPAFVLNHGLDYASLERINPRLVVTSITNFGQTGPYRDFRATELVLYGMGGEMFCTGHSQREPVRQGPYTSQITAGTIAAVATMGAYLGAYFNGIGQHTDVSMMETLLGGADRRSIVLLAYQYTGEQEPRMCDQESTGYPLGVHRCKNGYIVILGTHALWQRFLNMLRDSSEVFKDKKWEVPTSQLKGEFEAFFLPWCMERTKEEIIEIAQKYGIWCGPVNTAQDVLNDRHLQERKFWAKMKHPFVGELTLPGQPFLVNGMRDELYGSTSLLGEHNEEILSGLGYTNDDLIRLAKWGVI